MSEDNGLIPPTAEGWPPGPDHVLFDIEDADLPGVNGDAPAEPSPPSGITPDFTASKSRRRGAGETLRERFARSRKRREDGAPNPRASRRPPAPRTRAPKTVRVPNRKGQFVKPLTQFYTMLGMVTMSRDTVCGPAIVANAEACARSIDDLAYTNEWLRAILWNLTQTGMLTKVFLAHSPILFAVGMHHSERFRFAIDNSGMGEFIAGMLAEQAQAVRDALAAEEAQNAEAA